MLAIIALLALLMLYFAYLSVAEQVTLSVAQQAYDPGDVASFSSEVNISGRVSNMTFSLNGSDLDLNCSLPFLAEGDFYQYGSCNLSVIVRVPPGHGGGLGYSDGLTELSYLINWTIPERIEGGRYCATLSSWDFPGGELLLVNATCFNISPADLAPPVIRDGRPSNGTYTTDTLAPITATLSDDDSGVDISTLAVVLDGVDITDQCVKAQSFFIYNPEDEYADGTHTVNVSVADNAGNVADPYVWSFTVDTTAPVLIEQRPDDGDLVPNAIGQRFTLRYTEENPETVRLYYKEEGEQFYQYTDLSWCQGGIEETCTVTLDLRGYEAGDVLYYYFMVIDEVQYIASFLPYNVTLTYAPPADVLINEYLAVPLLGEEEFIELYALADVDLSGWMLDDAEGTGSSPYTMPNGTSILADERLVFWGNDTGIVLDDAGDVIRLLNASGSLIDQVTYGSATQNVSSCRYPEGEGNFSDCHPTPGAANEPYTIPPTGCELNFTFATGWNLIAMSCAEPVAASTATAPEKPQPDDDSEVYVASRDMPLRVNAARVKSACEDGIQNHGETGVDCGGPCPPCADSGSTVPATTSSLPAPTSTLPVASTMPSETPPTASCEDGIQNQGETGVDCGGPCPACQQASTENAVTGQAIGVPREDDKKKSHWTDTLTSSAATIAALIAASMAWLFVVATRRSGPVQVSKAESAGTIRLVIENKTNKDLKNVFVDDLVYGLSIDPADVSVDGAPLEARANTIHVSDERLTWDVGVIPPGGKRTLQYRGGDGLVRPVGKISWGGWT